MPTAIKHDSDRPRVVRAVTYFIAGGGLAAAVTVMGGVFQYVAAFICLVCAGFLAWPLCTDLKAKKPLTIEHYFEAGLTVALIVFAIFLVFFWHPESSKMGDTGHAQGKGSVGLNKGVVTNNFYPSDPKKPNDPCSHTLVDVSGSKGGTLNQSFNVIVGDMSLACAHDTQDFKVNQDHNLTIPQPPKSQ